MTSNAIGPTGITVQSYSDLLTYFTTQFQSIYGSDINLDPDSPDGQLINIFIQSVLDLEDLLVQTNAQFDPDQAIGAILDQRVAINGIQRQAGTFTITNVTVVNSQSVNLYGLDQSVQPVYTVADNANNQWQLQVTQTGLAAGTHVLAFQSAVAGAVLTVPNTITVPVTVVLGVTSVNNPTTYTTLGINEETDAALRLRRQQSVALASQGYLAGLIAALKNITGMESVFVYENTSGTTNGDGVPGHSIWVIVQGTAAAADIANAIYQKRNAGCGMYGAQTYTITQVDGSSFIVSWDNTVSENLFIEFVTTSINGTNPPNNALILSQLPVIFAPGVYQEVNINQLATLVQSIDPNTLVTSAGFSTAYNGSYTNTLTPASKNKYFAVSAANIIITPIILSPATVTVGHTATQQFTPYGGYGPYTYSISVNNSGGSINSSSGLYTAGSTYPVTDTVLVTDALSNTATASVSVT